MAEQHLERASATHAPGEQMRDSRTLARGGRGANTPVGVGAVRGGVARATIASDGFEGGGGGCGGGGGDDSDGDDGDAWADDALSLERRNGTHEGSVGGTSGGDSMRDGKGSNRTRRDSGSNGSGGGGGGGGGSSSTRGNARSVESGSQHSVSSSSSERGSVESSGDDSVKGGSGDGGGGGGGGAPQCGVATATASAWNTTPGPVGLPCKVIDKLYSLHYSLNPKPYSLNPKL